MNTAMYIEIFPRNLRGVAEIKLPYKDKLV